MHEAIILAAAQAVGGAQYALEITVQYAKDRQQFDKPLGAFQALAHYLADAATTVDGAEVLVHEAAWARAEGRPVDKLAPMAKFYACRTFRDVTAMAQQLFGGIGFTSSSTSSSTSAGPSSCSCPGGTPVPSRSSSLPPRSSTAEVSPAGAPRWTCVPDTRGSVIRSFPRLRYDGCAPAVGRIRHGLGETDGSRYGNRQVGSEPRFRAGDLSKFLFVHEIDEYPSNGRRTGYLGPRRHRHHRPLLHLLHADRRHAEHPRLVPHVLRVLRVDRRDLQRHRRLRLVAGVEDRANSAVPTSSSTDSSSSACSSPSVCRSARRSGSSPPSSASSAWSREPYGGRCTVMAACTDRSIDRRFGGYG